jgi:hypothetical protein
MLGEDAPLQGVTLLPRHRAHVERVSRELVVGLLQLAATDELHVGDGDSGGFPGVLVLEAAAQRGQHGREVVVQCGRCALADG